MKAFSNFVNGKHVEAADGRTTPVVNPVTGEQYAEAPLSGPEDVDAAMQAAAEAFETWRDTTPAERSLALFRIADAVEARAEELIALEVENTGKPMALTRSEEIPPMVDQLRFFATAARHLEGKAAAEYMAGHTSFVRREPIGVCAQVAPWNYPMMMAVWKFAPAIAAGNAVVLKPSDTTPASTTLLAEIAAEFLPPGVFNVICGDRDTGRAMVDHDVPAMVSITGSVRAGMEVAGAAARDLKRVHLELGGKAPVIVFDDADLDAAVEGISVAGYFNAGQDCTAATRVLAGPRRLRRLHRGPRRGRQGDQDRARPTTTTCSSGRSTTRASSSGSAASSSGRPTTPACSPAAAARATPGSSTSRRSSPTCARTTRWSRTRSSVRSSRCSGSATRTRRCAGPTACSTAWPRACGRRTSGEAMRMAKRLDFGCVWINTHIPLVAEMPHGGFKRSGYGKDLSQYGFEDYTRVKHVMANIDS